MRRDWLSIGALFLAVVGSSTHAGCASSCPRLTSVAPLPASIVSELSTTPVVIVTSPVGTASGVRWQGNRYLVVGHMRSEGPTRPGLVANFFPAKVVHSETCQVRSEWDDGWLEVVTTEEMTSVEPTSSPWSPYQALYLDQPIYLVAHPQAGNRQIRAETPFAPLDPLIVSSRVSGQYRGAFVRLQLDPRIRMDGMSGAACVTWDKDSRQLIIVGLYCGVLSPGEGLMVRPVPMKEGNDPRLDILPSRAHMLLNGE